MTQEEKNKAQEAYDKKIYKLCRICHKGHMEVYGKYAASNLTLIKGKVFIIAICSYCGLFNEYLANKLLDEEPEKKNEDKLNEELIDILRSEMRAGWPGLSSLTEKVLEHSLNVEKLEDLPRSRFWEAILLLKKRGRI